MSYLSDTFYLKRAGRYSSPLNTNDRLPVVYGDLTDGANGIWTLPCIDTDGGGMNPVYCYAGHETLSAANGNTVAIYEDGQELNSALYTFDESNDYEGKGVIATITFTSPKANAVITARGKGKPTTTGGATLMENVIDIVNDLLTVENDFTSALYESTMKANTRQIFEGQTYKAAGVIAEDGVIWDIITEMMASFLGSVYLNGAGELVLDIDDGSVSQYAKPIIRRGDATLVDARLRLANIINQCPANYCYNYADSEFKSETNDTAYADIASQNIYGVREPSEPYQFYWCRNLASVQKMQDIVVGKYAGPVYEIEIECSNLKHIDLDQGDIFIHSVDSLYDSDGSELWNHYWRTISVSPDFSKAKMNFRALQTACYMLVAYLADGTYTAGGSIKAGNNRDTTIY